MGDVIDSISQDAALPFPNDVEVVGLILTPDPQSRRIIWGLAVDRARIAGFITPSKSIVKEAIETAAMYMGNTSMQWNLYRTSEILSDDIVKSCK